MLEIIALIFLTKKNGDTAIRKGLNPGTWKLFTVLAWIGAEIIGIFVGLIWIGRDSFAGLVVCTYVAAFGGYLIVKFILDKKPDALDDDINRIGTKDLQP